MLSLESGRYDLALVGNLLWADVKQCITRNENVNKKSRIWKSERNEPSLEMNFDRHMLAGVMLSTQ
jgi:hypothetical protein